jgi:hypothetical protein
MTENIPRKVVIIRKKPCRTPLAQTKIDHDRCIERRRCNAANYDKMTQILNAALGGKATRENLLDLAEKLAAQKQLKIDRCARRMKEGLICWFCENACDFVSSEAIRYQDFDIETNSLDGWESGLLRSDDPLWILDPYQTP